eukprot:TRINITY_DN6772_c0_g1_i2.p2 TRINITY_DN6772_c0_g1~~TRINITY_DN6772_c0_g1_i2.p2  ORF type:complete len:148 (-),score=41.95 TRINITY_DN6772_c0_g1_i2:59-502(-)
MGFFFFFQAEDGIRDVERSRGLGDVYKRQTQSTWGDRKQLRDHYVNFLKIAANTEEFSEEEDRKLIRLIKKHGRAFSKISKLMQGRTIVMLKNRYNFLLSLQERASSTNKRRIIKLQKPKYKKTCKKRKTMQATIKILSSKKPKNSK